MEYYLGKRSRHSFALENVTYGTVNTAANWSSLGVVQSIVPSSKSELLAINSMDTSDTRNVNDYYENLRTYGATVEFLLQHCRPLVLAWGSDTFTVGSPDEHVITEANTLPSFGLNFGYGHATAPHAMDYSGCVVNKMDISCTKGEMLKCSAEIVAQDGANHAVRGYQTGDGLKHYPITGTGAIMPYQYSDVGITINGTTYTDVQSLRMTINNNLLSEPVLDSGNDNRIAEPIPQLREYDASMTVKMSSVALNDLWELGTKIATDPVITFQRGADDHVVFTLENATLESALHPFTVSEGMVVIELPMKVEKIAVVETNDLGTDYSTAEV